MGGTALIHDHLSGRFTATPAEEEAALDAMMDGSHLITTTEVDRNARARHLREPGWWCVYGDKGPRDDCGLAGRLTRLTLLEGFTEVLSDLTYVTERGVQSSKTVGAFAAVKDVQTGEVGVIAVAHLPHGMQDEIRTGKIRSDVAKAYRDIIKGLRRAANALARKWKAAWTMIVGDFNVNSRRPWTRAYLKVQFPNFKINWQPPYPDGGTFAGMLIDIALLRGIKVRRGPTILPRFKGFDHRGFEEALG